MLDPRPGVVTSAALLALLLLALSGCGGSSSSPPAPPPSEFGFATPVNLSTGGDRPRSAVIADFNQDGKLDIAVSNVASNNVSLFLNRGGGTFGAPTLIPVNVPISIGGMLGADLNHDGKMDLLLTEIAGEEFEFVLLGKGDGTFTQLPGIPNSVAFLDARLADVNGDGQLDLISCGNGNMGVALGKGDATFHPVVYLPDGPVPNAFPGCEVGDFNSDGKMDILGANFTDDPANLDLFLGDGTGTFQAPLVLSSGSPEAVSISKADFNGDGKPDVLVGFAFSTASLFLGNGDGTFGAPVSVYNGFFGQGTNVLAVDINKDGKPDALVAAYTLGVFTIRINSGSGITDQSKTITFTLDPGIYGMATADLNADGRPDIVLVNGTTNQITILMSK